MLHIRSIPIVAAAVAAAFLGHWLLRPGWSADQTALRLPIPESAIDLGPPVDLKGIFTAGTGKAMVHPAPVQAAWPCFRGPNRDARSDEKVKTTGWPGTGLPKVWEIPVGEGFAGPVIRDGKVYLLDYDEHARQDAIRCLSLDTGEEIWRRAYNVEVSRNHGFSRTVPALYDRFLITFGPKCHVVCLDATTGEFIWGIDLVRDHKATVPEWYAGQCPLVDNGKLILGVGGEALVMAVDVATGKVLWQTPNKRKWRQTHVSVVPMTFNGQKTYLYCGSGGVAGVSADDGTLLWETTEWKVNIAAVASPVVIDGERVFLTGGYGAGSMMLKLEESAGKITPQILYRLKPQVFGAEQHTPILHNGYLYGVIPGGQLVCLSLDGKVVWQSGPKKRFGLGGYMLANDALWLLNDSGTLTVVKADPKKFEQLATMEVYPDGFDAWGPPALAGGRLIVRDSTRMTCLDASDD